MTRSARNGLLISLLLATSLVGAWVGWRSVTGGADPSAPAAPDPAPDAERPPANPVEGSDTLRVRTEEVDTRRTSVEPEGPGSTAEAAAPLSGDLHVWVLGPHGAEEEEFVRLSLTDAATEDVDDFIRDPETFEGRRSFSNLPLGRDWTLWVEPKLAGTVALPVPGPSVERPEAEVTVRLAEHFVRYRMRLVDERGTPLVRREANLISFLHLPGGSSTGYGREVHTDDEGIVERWGSGQSAGAARREFQLRMPADRATGEPERRGSVELPPAPGLGLRDLGDVALAAEETVVAPADVRVVSGRVLDARGAPAARTVVELHAVDASGSQRVTGVSVVRAADDGAFALSGPAGALDRVERLVLRARSRELGAAARVVEAGDVVELRLEPPGEVRGRLLPIEGVDLTRFQAVLEPEPPLDPSGHDQRAGWHGRVRSDGSFRIDGRPAGRYDLHVLSDTSVESFLVVPGLDVPSGGPCADPRLEGIDLSSSLVRARLTILDAAAAPVEGGAWATTKVGSPAYRVEDRYASSTPELLLGPSPVAVTLVPDGHGTVELPSVHGDTTVQLPARRPLLLHVRIEGAFDDPTLRLQPVLGTARRDGPHPFESEDVLGEREGLRFPAVAEGTYALVWRASRLPHLSTEEFVPHRPRIDVVVPPGEGPCEVEVTVRAEDLLGIR